MTTEALPEDALVPDPSDIEVVDLSELSLDVATPDAPFAPRNLAVVAYRLRSFRDPVKARNPNLLREPFQTLAEVLHIPGRFALTVRLGVRGTRARPVLESDVVVAGVGDDEIGIEVEAAGHHLEQYLGGDHAPFHVQRRKLAALGWPRTGHGSFIRQQLMHVDDEGDGDGFDLPLRFSFPGPDAPYRLLNALLAAGPGVDLFITVSPTTLWRDEHARLQRAQRAVVVHNMGLELQRGSATAIDAWLSYRTDLYVLQLLVVSQIPPTEVLLRSVASALTASYDAERRAGSRVVARAERFLGGGFEIEPCRDPTEVLKRLWYGMPWIGFRSERELVDLVTSTEVGFSFAWLADPEGNLPGVSITGAAAPPVPERPGTVRLGHDAHGGIVRLADTDRHLHTVLVGATGCGKTTLLVDLAVQDALAGRGVVVVDPHGDMNDRIAARLPESFATKTYYLDAASGSLDHLNLLGLFPPETDRQKAVTFALVDGMIADLNRDFSGPVFHRVMRRLLHLASLVGGTMLDVDHYLADPEELALAAQGTRSRELRELASEVAEWPSSHRAEMITYVAGKLEWLASPGLRSTFSTPSSSFCLPEALGRGDVILVNPASDHHSGEVAMSTFLEALLCCLSERRSGEETISLYLDEVQRYCGHVVRRLANELRKRSVALHAATQNLTNLGQHLEALVGNAGNLIVGRCSGPTAAVADAVMGDVPVMSRLPNFHAIARLTPDGQPCDAFELIIDRPTEPRPAGPPAWLVDAATERRKRASSSSKKGSRRAPKHAQLVPPDARTIGA